MNIVELMDALPIWGVFLTLVATIFLSFEFGFRLSKQEEKHDVEATNIRTGRLVTASLGLLAFMLVFTFSTVTSRYNERKNLVLEEANVIGTTYLRAGLLPQADRMEIQRILHQYVSLRIETVQVGDITQLSENMTQAKELQKELWSMALDIAARNPTPITALFLQSLNDLIDLHQKRVTVAIDHRMPSFFWAVLFGLTILSMVVGGYDAGLNSGRRSTTALLTTTLAFSMVLLLVIVLDRPGHKISTVTQSALIDLQQDIRSSRQSQP